MVLRYAGNVQTQSFGFNPSLVLVDSFVLQNLPEHKALKR
jgi:hypothetical protein